MNGFKSLLFKRGKTLSNEMFEEIYDYDERLSRLARRIRALRNGDIAIRFLDHLRSLGLSLARVSKYAGHMPALLKVIDFNLQEASRDDVEKVMAQINRQHCTEWTRHDKKLVLKKLVQYAKYGRCSRDTPYPPEVNWIKLRVDERKAMRVTPDKLLNAWDFEALIKAADNQRDKAMLHVLFEAALRPSELLTMKVGSVEFRDNHCLISVFGKTGVKRIPLVVSFRPLLEWLEVHPKRTEPDAPLWCSLATNYKGERLSYRRFRLIIRRIAKKAGLKKAVWPYLFRHSALTAMAKVLTESRLELYAGWVQGSKMARRYVHFAARDLEDAILELHGLRNMEEKADLLRLAACPRCGEPNPPGTVRCGKCGFILDRKLAMEIEERERGRLEKIEEELSQLKMLVSSLLHQKAPEPQPPAPQSSSTSPQARVLEQQHTPQTFNSPEESAELRLKTMEKGGGGVRKLRNPYKS